LTDRPPTNLELLERRRLAKQVADLEQQIAAQKALPHLYGMPWYSWAWEFFSCRERVALLTAANQISKSSTQIRTCVEWATNKKLWRELWPDLPEGGIPNLFWYFYPDQTTAEQEFEAKWKQFLPRDTDHPDSGWKSSIVKGTRVIKFNSGVSVYLRTYGQDIYNLQSGSVYALFADEEMPVDYYDELSKRLLATNGYFRMVFTATLGQDLWRRAMEPTPEEIRDGKEFLPFAWKKTVSLYDSMAYHDGTPSPWTAEKIRFAEAMCSSELEIQKRIHGRFIIVGGRKYPNFDTRMHYCKPHPYPASWLLYASVDYGSGEKDEGLESRAQGTAYERHPSALLHLLVSPDFRKGRVVKAWRGDGIRTTQGDLVERHIRFKQGSRAPTQQVYDWSATDFYTIATARGESFIKADKSHEKGEDLINLLFKHSALLLEADDPEIMKLGGELGSLQNKTNKKVAKDDLIDALRYAVMTVPWDIEGICGGMSLLPDPNVPPPLSPEAQEIENRRNFGSSSKKEDEWPDVESEMDELNGMY
jgi:hypothetical protein